MNAERFETRGGRSHSTRKTARSFTMKKRSAAERGRDANDRRTAPFAAILSRNPERGPAPVADPPGLKIDEPEEGGNRVGSLTGREKRPDAAPRRSANVSANALRKRAPIRSNRQNSLLLNLC